MQQTLNKDITDSNKVFGATLSEKDFTTLSHFIYVNYGIKIPPRKKILLQSRLHKRLRFLKMNGFTEYIDYVFSNEGEDEIIEMIDVVSTNKTDFFREPTHFEFLSNVILPEFIQMNQLKRPLKIWSAACSSGEEPYSIAIVLNEFLEKKQIADYSIFATDICTTVLEKAENAIYSEEKTSSIPILSKRKYLIKGKQNDKRVVQIIPSLREKVHFQRLNFMEDTYNVRETFDVIFCRNVLMYFDLETQTKVINKLCKNLYINGYFFYGQSELFAATDVPLEHVKSNIFLRI